MIVCKDEIKDAIEQQLVEANKSHPSFASLHEAYAVILEELEEVEEQFELCRTQIKLAWERIKQDKTTPALITIRSLEHSAKHLAEEACQVSAMAIKAQQSETKKGVNT